jgi:hypothetical protein
MFLVRLVLLIIRPTATNSNLSDDVARGGHATVKVAQELVETEQLVAETHSVDAQGVAADAVATSPPTVSPVSRSSHEIQAIAVDLTTSNTVESGKGRKKKNTSSAARIAKKLRVSENVKPRQTRKWVSWVVLCPSLGMSQRLELDT